MLTVTDAALEHLHAALSRADANEACFRFRREDANSVGLEVKQPGPDDQTFECNGDVVLATPEPLIEPLSKKVLDVDEEGQLILLPTAADA